MIPTYHDPPSDIHALPDPDPVLPTSRAHVVRREVRLTTGDASPTRFKTFIVSSSRPQPITITESHNGVAHVNPTTEEIPMYNPASDTDIDRRYVEELDEAEAILSRYVAVDSMTPVHIVSLDAMARERATNHPALDHTSAHDVALVFGKIQAVLKERCVAEITRLDRVHLDLTGEHGNRAWAADVPAIVFCNLTSQDTLFVPGRQQALAVYFDPTMAGFVTATARNGQVYSKPNVYSPDGYVAIVGSFGSTAEANEAQAELRRAVTTIATTRLALDDDGEDGDDGVQFSLDVL